MRADKASLFEVHYEENWLKVEYELRFSATVSWNPF